MGMPRFAELAKEALMEDISDSGRERLSQNFTMTKNKLPVTTAPTAVKRSGKDVAKMGLAEGFKEQRGTCDEESQGAQDRTRVVSQDSALADEHAHQNDGPHHEEPGKDAQHYGIRRGTGAGRRGFTVPA
jgi:hypothetical protein